jgi:hypothetical protein
MTRVIWLQHRGQALFAVLTLAVMCGLMLWVGLSASHTLAPFGAAGCLRSSTATAIARLGPGKAAPQCAALERFAPQHSFAIPVFEEGVPAALAVLGVLVGAPLVAREIEQRTQLVDWTQSVSRKRWYVTKTICIGAGLTLIALIAGFANDWLQGPLTDGGLTSSRWPWFFSIDLAPAGEVLLAFTLAVAIGAWLRRTLPAIGSALVAFIVLLLAAAVAVRTLSPRSHAAGSRPAIPRDAWDIGLRLYHPASQYWPLQIMLLAILLALGGALISAGWYATRTRAV